MLREWRITKQIRLYNCTAENCGEVGVSYFLFKNNEHGDLETFSVHNTAGQLSNFTGDGRNGKTWSMKTVM